MKVSALDKKFSRSLQKAFISRGQLRWPGFTRRINKKKRILQYRLLNDRKTKTGRDYEK